MKIPRTLPASELIKALSRYQYSVERQKGSHIRLTTSLKRQHHITNPKHNPLKIGTLSSIIGDVANHLEKTKEEIVQELFG
jgi:predicted RNA binding protein YcfA (HicA-like mRNA interferase family)